MNMNIDKEFQGLIPPLTADEYQGLEQNILAEGCRDALIVWGDTLIDGHNRYSICNKHGIPFKTSEKAFESRDDAMLWIIDNQNSRRNLSDYVKFELKDKKTEILSKKGKEKQLQTLKQNATTVPSIIDKTDKHDTRKVIADELGWSTGKTAQAKIVKEKAPEEIKTKLRAGDMTINQAYQSIKREEKIEAVKEKFIESAMETKSVDIFTTNKQYNIVYADPAWSYWEGGQKNQSLHYATMSLGDICNLPVKDIADTDCILFLWVTFPILQESFKVIESWGFKYSTCGFVWVKKNKNTDTPFVGCGSWTRANSELCLIATKGNITRLDAGISQIIESPIDVHSKKPAIVRQLITKLVGELPRIELFSRQATDGWDSWGNEI
jgi:N6-adenosine-specific RNA methylase IME4